MKLTFHRRQFFSDLFCLANMEPWLVPMGMVRSKTSVAVDMKNEDVPPALPRHSMYVIFYIGVVEKGPM